jgi:putative ABC transport system substrate-binding protein
MNRREVIIAGLAGLAVWPLTARAQQSVMMRVRTANVQPRSAPQWVAFVRRMADHGYVEGINFTYDHVQIPSAQTWEAAYRDVVVSKPNIVVAAGPDLSLKSALAAADMLPVVMIAVDYDPITRGYVTNLARPTGTISGVYFQSTELVGKRLQLLKDAFPDLTTTAVFWDQSSADHWTVLQIHRAPIQAATDGCRIPRAPLRLRSGTCRDGP